MVFNGVGKVNADIIEDSYVFMRRIRGTPAYWRNELMDLLARIKTLGAPTWFVTLYLLQICSGQIYPNYYYSRQKRTTHT